MIKPGIYPDLSIEDYHGDKSSISRSSLKDFARNPYYYWAKHINPERPIEKPTDAMIFGQAFHVFALEPNKFNDLYVVEPKKVFLKDVGRKEYDEYKTECESLEKSNKIIISREDLDLLGAMTNSLFKNSRVQKMLKMLGNAEIEKSFFWEDEESGLIIKARPDVLQYNLIIDLKTISDASVYSYQKAMTDNWYHVQGAMIRNAVQNNGMKLSTVINICIEKKYPYCVGIYIIDEAALDYASDLYKRILLDMKSCIISNSFNDFQVQTVGLPKWSL